MDDDSSDDSSQIETLDQFREKWHKELNTTKRNQKKTTKNISSTHSAGRTDDDGKNSKDHQVNSLQNCSNFVDSIVVHSHFSVFFLLG